MKIRNGFVSNSSTASFVVFGIKGTQKKNMSYEEIDAFYEDMEEFSKNNKLDYINDEDDIYIGKTVSYLTDDGINRSSKKLNLNDLKSVQDKLEDLEEEIKKLVDTDFNFGLYSGMCQC